VTIRTVMAREDIPRGPSVFLAGPSHADPAQSWRPAAIDLLKQHWPGEPVLNVISPESRGGVRAQSYLDQVRWETMARGCVDVVMFWIPRDVVHLPGFTTNVEFGMDVTTGRVVLGCPLDCPNPERNRYLIAVADMHNTPVRHTLEETVRAGVKMAARSGTTRGMI
jgi:hypothetical protein